MDIAINIASTTTIAIGIGNLFDIAIPCNIIGPTPVYGYLNIMSEMPPKWYSARDNRTFVE